MGTKQIIKYWLKSLADSELASIDLKRNSHTYVPQQQIESGRLNSYAVTALFTDPDEKQEPDDEEDNWINVVVIPIVAYKSNDHRGRQTKIYHRIYPLFIPAGLNPNGVLFYTDEFAQPWIPRNLLEPTSNELAVGSLESMEEFQQTRQAVLSQDADANWGNTLSLAYEMLDEVSNGEWTTAIQEAGLIQTEDALVVNVEKISGMANNIIRVYDRLLVKEEFPQLLGAITSPNMNDVQASIEIEERLDLAAKHLGSFHDQFALAPSQRKAIHHAFSLAEGDVLAINGPPGTGKTTLLHSIIASLWVQSALSESEPPIVVVSSTNNQAVMNVLDSLKRIDTLERWIPIQGFGIYLVNQSKKQEWAKEKDVPFVDKMGNGFPSNIESHLFTRQFKKKFLRKCSKYFDKHIRTLSTAIAMIHAKLVSKSKSMKAGLSIAFEYDALSSRLATMVGDSGTFEQRKSLIEEQIDQKQDDLRAMQKKRAQWLEYCQKEPVLYSLLSFLPAFKRKRRYRYQQFISANLPGDQVDPNLDEIENVIAERVAECRRSLSDSQEQLQKLTDLRDQISAVEHRWAVWRKAAGAKSLILEKAFALETAGGEPEPLSLLNWLDTNLRYELLEIASHYWEGRWLMEMAGIEASGQQYVRRWDTIFQEKRFRRYAMLTPCFITTMHSGPSFFDYYRGQPEPLFNVIDWLIVDEAGQVSPEIAGGMIALSKRAIVVGDRKQIEPIWSISGQLDRTNLQRIGIAKDDQSFSEFMDSGLSSSCGSLMKIAQLASKYSDHKKANAATTSPGMLLTEHRRSVPKIITYCNELAYEGNLELKRKPLVDYPWSPIAYIHVKGDSIRVSGSRKNEREAMTAVTWISENRVQLENHYEQSIEEIVGVITPFAVQKRFYRKILIEHGLEPIRAGTVHAFQGAERPVIIFSPVYTSRDSGIFFFDRNVNMLNVAVSRAKDLFLAVGDMDIFDPYLENPSGLLGQHLFASDENELNVATLPPRKKEKARIDIHHIRTFESHIQTLRRAFEKAQERLVIVSPFLRIRAVTADQIPKMTAEAVNRDVEVIICTDFSFNEGLDLPAASEAAAALRDAGAKVVICNNIHSKVICIDDSIFIEGSFNWLSAEREREEYKRHDSSIIYMGDQVAEFIEQTLGDLRLRIAK